MKLSAKIRDRRTDRLDEWSMDELAKSVETLENALLEIVGLEEFFRPNKTSEIKEIAIKALNNS